MTQTTKIQKRLKELVRYGTGPELTIKTLIRQFNLSKEDLLPHIQDTKEYQDILIHENSLTNVQS